MSTAKGIAGGIPCGIMMTKEKYADVLGAGDHASTFGGNPLAAAAGNVVVDELLGGLLDNVKENGIYLTQKLKELADKYSFVKDVRGIGFMQGMELEVPVAPVISRAIENGLLLVNAGKHIIRFVPSLIATKEDIDKAMSILDTALAEVK